LSSIVVFVATQALPSDPARAILGRDATEERVAALRRELDLDRPVVTQYVEWAKGLATGDMGNSLATRQPVTDVVGPALRNSLTLMAVSALIALPLAVAIGVLAAMRRDKLLDRTALGVSLVLTALPEFVIAMLLVILFATTVFHLLPAVALIPPHAAPWTRPRELALPVLTLVLAVVPALYRLVRASMVDALDSDYSQMARLKGLPPRRVARSHALPNAAVPTVQASGLMLGYLFSGTVVVEQVFRYPGLGSLLVDAVGNRDLPVIQVVTIIYTAAVVVFSLLTDIITHLISPRARTSGSPR
jgi:peptide/nickel transport system permease protein